MEDGTAPGDEGGWPSPSGRGARETHDLQEEDGGEEEEGGEEGEEGFGFEEGGVGCRVFGSGGGRRGGAGGGDGGLLVIVHESGCSVRGDIGCGCCWVAAVCDKMEKTGEEVEVFVDEEEDLRHAPGVDHQEQRRPG